MERPQKRDQNEVLFKHLNRQFAEVMTSLFEQTGQSASQPVEFFCECNSKSCVATISLSVTCYGAILEGADKFIVVPGHEEVGEKVLEKYADYSIIEKDKPLNG